MDNIQNKEVVAFGLNTATMAIKNFRLVGGS